MSYYICKPYNNKHIALAQIDDDCKGIVTLTWDTSRLLDVDFTADIPTTYINSHNAMLIEKHELYNEHFQYVMRAHKDSFFVQCAHKQVLVYLIGYHHPHSNKYDPVCEIDECNEWVRFIPRGEWDPKTDGPIYQLTQNDYQTYVVYHELVNAQGRVNGLRAKGHNVIWFPCFLDLE